MHAHFWELNGLNTSKIYNIFDVSSNLNITYINEIPLSELYAVHLCPTGFPTASDAVAICMSLLFFVCLVGFIILVYTGKIDIRSCNANNSEYCLYFH